MSEDASSLFIQQQWEIVRARLVFLERWVLSNIRTSPYPRRIVSTTTIIAGSPKLKLGFDRITADYEAMLQVQAVFAEYALSRKSVLWLHPKPIYEWLSGSKQEFLVRALRPSAHSVHERSLGITCSNIAECKPYATFERLQEDQVLSEESLRNQCGGTEPSSFISASDDPCWLNKHMEALWSKTDFEGGHIAFIHTGFLDRLGILFDRSDQLVTAVGAVAWDPYASQDGINYIHTAHWLIYGWVPPQAIRAVVAVHDFGAACTALAKGKGSSKEVFHVRPEEVLEHLSI